MNVLEEKAAEALAHVIKAERLMEEIGDTKYQLSGMISAEMRYDLEKEILKLLGELAEARERIKQHNRSFAGHVYVTNEEYSELCEVKRQRDILVNALRHCRLFIVERKGYMSHEVLERQLIKEKIDTALAAVKGYEA